MRLLESVIDRGREISGFSLTTAVHEGFRTTSSTCDDSGWVGKNHKPGGGARVSRLTHTFGEHTGEDREMMTS
ncbi:hypothetical protein Hanom_Chr03g00267421 [Helianthus anomalus]